MTSPFSRRVASRWFVANQVPIYSSHVYLSRTLHRGINPDCDAVQDLIERLKAGDTQAADECARVMAKHPALRGFSGVVVPAPRSASGRASLLQLASALVRHGVGSRASAVVERVVPVESSRMRRRRGEPGLTEEEHAATLGVRGDVRADEPILVVDDIYTTGATIRAVARVLRASGHVGVIVGATAGYLAESSAAGECPVEHTRFAGQALVVAPPKPAEALMKGRPGAHIVRASSDGQEVGYLLFSPSRDGGYSVEQVWVHRDFRRRGIASSMYAEATAWLKSRGEELHAGMLTSDASRALWERKVERGEAVRLPDDRWGPRFTHMSSQERVAARYKSKKKVPTADGGERVVYEYSERQVQNRNREKAERIEALGKSIGDLRDQVKKDLKSKDAKVRLTALAIGLMDATYERVGNDDSADEGHYGVTGWLRKHVTFGKGKATVRYVGKSGVKHEKTVDDAKLVKALKGCCEDKSKDAPLLSFGADDSEGVVRVTSKDVNTYLEPFDVTAKDLRGFHANREMRERLKATRKAGPSLPTDKKERGKILKDEFKKALEETAEAVGHEPSTLRSQYLVPGLEDQFMRDGSVDAPKTGGSARVLDLLVRPLLRFRQRGNPIEADHCGDVEGTHVCGDDFEFWEALLDSVRRKGVLRPVEFAWWGSRPQITDGHHRLNAAWEVGLKTIPVLVEGTITDAALAGWGLLHQKVASAPLVLRPSGWQATSDAGSSFLRSLRRPGVVFRGMTEAEYRATVGAGRPIRSTGAFSHPSEGTNFAGDAEDAESYVDFGRDDPRKTGRPNYLVEVARVPEMEDTRDGYVRSPVPVSTVRRVWALEPEGDTVVLRQIRASLEPTVRTSPDPSRVASRHLMAESTRVATKSEGEREDEEAERLVRPSPKKKPPRSDSRRERMDTDADSERDKDKSLNHKDVGG